MAAAEEEKAAAITVEVCVDRLSSAVAAQRGGAQRLELCCALVDGGLTPSIGLIRAVVRAVDIPVHVLIRCRPGDFCYDDDEVDIMVADVEAAKTAGASGVVVGVLTPEGDVDVARTARLVKAARPLSVTFHRAIDVARDALAAYTACAELGVDRVLSSGQANSAMEGVPVLSRLVKRQAEHGGPIVLAGGGLRASNLAAVVAAAGVTEVHGTARTTIDAVTTHRVDKPVFMGGEKTNSAAAEYSVRVATTESVAAFVKAAGGVTSSTALSR